MKIKTLSLLLLALFCACKSFCQDNDSAVTFSARADNKFLCPNKKDVYLYIEAKGGNGGNRLPLNISLVVDRSGSMAEEERMHHAKQALMYFIDQLKPNDNVSIVLYDHVAELLHGSEPVRDKEDVKRKIHHHIHPRGATNISHGLELGYQEVKSTFSKDHFNRVILISDGIANQGITDDFWLEAIVRDQATQNNISLSAFGFGHEFNEVLMHDMAEAGGGNYYFVETASQAILDFEQEFKLLGSVTAKNTVIAVNVPQGLTLTTVYGHKYLAQGSQVYIDLKEVHPGEVNGMLIKFAVTDPQSLPASLVFNATIDYDNADNNTHHHKQEQITIATATDPQACQNNLDMAMLEKVSFYSSNALLDGAMSDVEYGKLEHAKSKIHQAKTMINSLPAAQSNPQLQQQGQLLNEYDTHLSKHGANTHNVKHLHKRIRHKNHKLRKNKTQQPATATSSN